MNVADANLLQPKTKRQRAILALIAARPVRSQEELAMLLEQQGYEVTQATISRDIKELGLMKVPLKGGAGNQFKYVEPNVGPMFSSRLHRIVAELVGSVRGSVNQIVLRTPPGSAMMVASAIDAADWPEVLGTLGGDDTVLVIVDDPEKLPMVMQRFEDMRTKLVKKDIMQIVLAYSGGLDTSVLLKQYIEAGHDVVAMTLNLGESDMVAGDGSQAALDAVRKKALDLGAKDAVLIDARERFIRNTPIKALAANARYQGDVSAFGRALAAADRRLLVEVARTVRLRCGRARLHGQGQRSGSHRGRRARTRAASRRARTAAREAALAARRDRLRAKAQRADLAHRGQAVFGRRQPVGPLDRSRRARRPLERAARRCLRVDGQSGRRSGGGHRGRDRVRTRRPLDERRARRRLSSSSSTRLAGANGVGRIDMIEDRVVGLKSREVYECPARSR